MSSESICERLDRYYKEQGIAAVGFNCKHRAACEEKCTPGEMVCLPASYVGPEYEVGTLPRLLFVSSDTNDASWLKEFPVGWGSLRDIREDTLQHHRRSGASTHWQKTLNLAGVLLERFAMDRLGRGIDRDKVVEYIAHARSIRCKDSSIGSGEGDNKVMPSNCREFLVGEVMAMQPDIIVTQGARARAALAGAFPVVQRVPMQGNPYHGAFYEIVQIAENHKAIKIAAWHPCAHWKGNDQRQFMYWAAKSVQEFIPVA